jgi:hypothetical protein
VAHLDIEPRRFAQYERVLGLLACMGATDTRFSIEIAGCMGKETRQLAVILRKRELIQAGSLTRMCIYEYNAASGWRQLLPDGLAGGCWLVAIAGRSGTLDVTDSDGALTLSAAWTGMPAWEASGIACSARAPWHCIGGTVKQLATGYWQMNHLKSFFQAQEACVMQLASASQCNAVSPSL